MIATGLTGTDGILTFAELVPGRPILAGTAAGYRPLALPVEVTAQGVTRTEAELSSGSQVQGVVTVASRPPNDARVTLVDAAGDVMATATTGEDGCHGFTDLDGGEHTVMTAGFPRRTPT